jgi:hypothetical protein
MVVRLMTPRRRFRTASGAEDASLCLCAVSVPLDQRNSEMAVELRRLRIDTRKATLAQEHVLL